MITKELEVDRGMLICLVSALVKQMGGRGNMFFTKKVRRDLLAAISERVHETRLETVYDYLRTLQTELATLKKQVKILLEEKEKQQ